MTARRTWADGAVFYKRYPSAQAARTACDRSAALLRAGIATPAVQPHGTADDRVGFTRIFAGAVPPSLGDMLGLLGPLHRMQLPRLQRHDPFARIGPRLGQASAGLVALTENLRAQDAAIGWPARTVVHGDFHPGQTICDAMGRLWLIDLDDLALAPPEADLGNLAAWMATQAPGMLTQLATTARNSVLAVAGDADPALTAHFQTIALVRRGLKLRIAGQGWVADQLALWA